MPHALFDAHGATDDIEIENLNVNTTPFPTKMLMSSISVLTGFAIYLQIM